MTTPAKRPRPATASSSTSEPKPKRIKEPKILLYDKCLSTKAAGLAFTVVELEAFGILKGAELFQACQDLISSQLFVPAQKSGGGGTVYRTRRRQDALKIVKLKQDPLIVYTYIEGSEDTGIWKKHLVNKANLHENVVTKCLKELVAVKLVKEVKSARFPSKRIYMLIHLEPSMENTGGSFFSEGEMDTAMIDIVGGIIVKWIQDRSWAEDMRVPPVAKTKKKKEIKLETAAATAALDAGGPVIAIEVEDKPERPAYNVPLGNTKRPLIAHMPGYDQYPTVKSVQTFIKSSGIIKDKSLTIADVARLLTRLEYAGQLERMRMPDGQNGYRTVRQSFDPRRDDGSDNLGPVDAHDLQGFGVGNGFTQIPCGRCPVSRFCVPGGQVSPEKCVYMEEWLAMSF